MMPHRKFHPRLLSLGLTLGALLISGLLTPVGAAPNQVLRVTDHAGLTPTVHTSPQTLASSGDWLAAGYPYIVHEEGEPGFETEMYSGRVLLWQRVNGLWVPRQILQSPGPVPRASDAFGTQVLMDGKHMLVASESQLGQTHAFRLVGDTWVSDGRLVKPGPDPDRIANDHSIALCGDTAVVGVPLGRVKKQMVGFVDVYQRLGTGWVHKARLSDTHPLISPSSISTREGFGTCVALSADTLYASNGQRRISIFKKTGSTWAKSRDLHLPTGQPEWIHVRPVVSGNRLFAFVQDTLLQERFLEFSPDRSYEIVTQQVITDSFFWTSRGNFAFLRGQSQGVYSQAKIYTRRSDESWGLSQTLEPAQHGLTSVSSMLLGEKDLFIEGSASGQAQINVLTSPAPATSQIEFDYAGPVTLNPPVPLGGEGALRLDAGEILGGKEIKNLVTISAFHSGTQPVTLKVTGAEENDSFTLSTTTLTLQPGKKATLGVRFKAPMPTNATGKSVSLLFIPQGQPLGNETAAGIVIINAVVRPLSQAMELQFTQQPQSGLYLPLDCPGLQARVSGTGPITYRWLKNGSPVPGETTTTLHPKEGGSYQLEATNPRGKVLSQPALIGFYHVPVPQITTTTSRNVKCSVVISGPGLKVQWLNENLAPLPEDLPYIGVDKPTLTLSEVPEFPGMETLNPRITLPLPNEQSLTATAQIQVIPTPAPALVDPGRTLTYKLGEYVVFWPMLADGYMGPQYVPPYVTYPSLPPGLFSEPSQGTVYGTPAKPGTYTLAATLHIDGFTVSKSYRLIILPDGPTPGIYGTLIERTETLPEIGDVTLNVGTGGSYSGTLRLGATTRVSMAGILARTSGASTSEKPFPVKIQGKAHVYWLQKATQPDEYDLQARLADLPPGNHRDVLHLATLRLIKPHGPPSPSLVRAAHFALENEGGDPTVRGHGWGTYKVAATGVVTLAGQMPDGSTITGSTWYSPLDHHITFYQTDSRTGSVLYGRTHASGGLPLLWERAPGPGRAYPGGVSAIPLSFHISGYLPEKDVPLLGSQNVILSFAVPGASIPDVPATLTAKHTVQFGTVNPIAAKLTITPGTGLFTGQFTLKDPDPYNPARTLTRTVTFKGILMQITNQAFGCFQLPALPDPDADPPTQASTSPIISGSVLIEAAEAAAP